MTKQARTADATPVTSATAVPTTTTESNAAVRAPVTAASSGSSSPWAIAPLNPPPQSIFQAPSYGAPSTPGMASSQPVAPAAHHAVSRAPAVPSTIIGPQPATAYNYTSGFIVDSTDNPGGITSIGAADTLTVSNGIFEVGSFHTGVFSQNGGTVTVGSTSPLLIGNHAGSRGTYNLLGGIINSSVSAFVGYDGLAVFNHAGGTFNITGLNSLYIGFDDNSNSQYNLSAGVLNTSETIVSDHTNVCVFNQTGGIHTVGALLLSNFVTGSNGTYNLDGGTLNAGYITRGTNTSFRGTGTFNFNGGLLRATRNDNPNSATPFLFFSDLSLAQVRDGGVVIDTNTFNVTIAQALLHSGITGDAATDGGLTKNGTGTLTLTGVSTYNGSTTVNAGTLAVAGGSLTATGMLTVNNTGTLSLSGAGNIAVGGVLFNSGTFNQSGGTFGIDNLSVVYIGLNGTSTVNQTGGTFYANGLIIGYSGSSASGNYNLSGATSLLSTKGAIIGLQANGAFVQSGGTFTTNGNALTLGTSSGFTGSYTLSGGNLSTGSATVAFNSTFSQSGGIFTNNNSLDIGGTSGQSGGYTLSGGALTTGASAITGGSGSSSFTQTGGTHTTGGVAIGSAGTGSAGVYNLDGGTLSTGSITGGAGTSRLLFNGGIVQPRGDSTSFISGITGANVRNGGAIFDTAGFNVTVPQVLAHSNFDADNATDGGLTKKGGGILSLTGANTYTGTTTVQVGTLAANNTSGSATGSATVNVLPGATLAGNGAIAGNVTLNNAAILNPGNAGPGRLTIGGTLTLSSGSAFMLELGGTTAGSQYDQIVLNGPMATGGLFALNGSLSVTKVNGFTLAVGQKFFIIDETGTNPVGGIGAFTNAPANVYTDAAGNRFAVNYADINPADGNTIANDVSLTVLTVAAVPEPSTWALLLLGVGGVVLLRGRWNRVAGASWSTARMSLPSGCRAGVPPAA